MTLTMEDDLFYSTDEDYSYGSKLLFLFNRENLDAQSLQIPFLEPQKYENYISFAFSNQIYTPEDLEESEVIENDRVYAGYIYLEAALYQSCKNSLYTLALRIGVAGEGSHMEFVQKSVHELTHSKIPQGWDNQLSNEFILQVNYNYKHYLSFNDFLGLEVVVIPEYGFNLGNASTKAYLGSLLRYGWNVPKNYGAFSINNSTYSQIPLSKTVPSEKFLFCLNFGVQGNGVAQNIFLDGNSNRESHRVEKNNFILNVIYGLSLKYRSFGFDWVHNYTTREFTLQKDPHRYTSVQFSYSY